MASMSDRKRLFVAAYNVLVDMGVENMPRKVKVNAGSNKPGDDAQKPFGVPLEREADMVTANCRIIPGKNVKVPRAFKAVLDALMQCDAMEGLYRVSANSHKLSTVVSDFKASKALPPLPAGDSNTKVLAALHKQLFRDLPVGLLHNVKGVFLALERSNGELSSAELLEGYSAALQMLPSARHTDLFLHLFGWLHEVSGNAVTKMTASNLATCFGPNLFHPMPEDPKVQLAETKQLGNAVAFLIERFPDVAFPAPGLKDRARRAAEADVNKQYEKLTATRMRAKSQGAALAIAAMKNAVSTAAGGIGRIARRQRRGSAHEARTLRELRARTRPLDEPSGERQSKMRRTSSVTDGVVLSARARARRQAEASAATSAAPGPRRRPSMAWAGDAQPVPRSNSCPEGPAPHVASGAFVSSRSATPGRKRDAAGATGTPGGRVHTPYKGTRRTNRFQQREAAFPGPRASGPMRPMGALPVSTAAGERAPAPARPQLGGQLRRPFGDSNKAIVLRGAILLSKPDKGDSVFDLAADIGVAAAGKAAAERTPVPTPLGPDGTMKLANGETLFMA